MPRNKKKPKKKSRLREIVEISAAILAALGAAYTLIGYFCPTCLHNQTNGGKLENVRIEPSVTLAEYFKRRGWNTNGYSEQKLRTAGFVVTYSLTLEGLQGVRCPFYFHLHDADTHQQVSQPDWYEEGQPQNEFTPDAPKDAINTDLWLTVPDDQKRYFVRLEIYDGQKSRLDSVDIGLNPVMEEGKK